MSGKEPNLQHLYGRVLQWFRGIEAKPSPQELQVYNCAASFHGFQGSELDLVVFDATFLAAFTRSFLDSKPVFFFTPKVHSAWCFARATELCQKAVRNKPESKEALKGALVRIKTDAPPWALDTEPESWVAFGFSEGDGVLLPDWCKAKLI